MSCLKPQNNNVDVALNNIRHVQSKRAPSWVMKFGKDQTAGLEY